MMGYNVEKLATEFMVTPLELQDIFVNFFAETSGILEKGSTAFIHHNLTVLAKLAHELKGLTANLRMNEMAETAALMEKAAKNDDYETVGQYLQMIEKQFVTIRQEVNNYYNKKTN